VAADDATAADCSAIRALLAQVVDAHLATLEEPRRARAAQLLPLALAGGASSGWVDQIIVTLIGNHTIVDYSNSVALAGEAASGWVDQIIVTRIVNQIMVDYRNSVALAGEAESGWVEQIIVNLMVNQIMVDYSNSVALAGWVEARWCSDRATAWGQRGASQGRC
jgi:hypothetical protein